MAHSPNSLVRRPARFRGMTLGSRSALFGFALIAVLGAGLGGAVPAHAFSSGNLDGIAYVPVEVESGQDFTLAGHGSGDQTPVTFGGCMGVRDGDADPTLTWFSSASTFPDITDAVANPGPLLLMRTTDLYATNFGGDCSSAPSQTPSFTASVTVLPATEITSDMTAQELVAGDSTAPATASTYYFDTSEGLGWSLDDSGACADTAAMPAGIELDSTWSASDEIPAVHLSGTPERGTAGVHYVCLALSDNFGNTGFAVLTLTVTEAPTLPDTGASSDSIDSLPGISAAIVIIAGIALVTWLRGRRHRVN